MESAAVAARRKAAARVSLGEWEREDAWRYAGHALELARDAATARAAHAGALAVHGRDADALAKAAQRAECLLASFEAWRLHLLALACPNCCGASVETLSAAATVADAHAWKVVEVWRASGPAAAGEALRAECAALLKGCGVDLEGAGDDG